MNELTLQNRQDSPLTVGDLLAQVNLIQQVMSAVMKEGEHFGRIPGCGDKPALLQPGAQKLLVTFRLAPEYAVTEKMLNGGHREYQILCTLKTIGSGSFVGQGAGSASTMEGKWRFRVAPKKLTDRPVPKEYWDIRKTDGAKAQELLGGTGFSTKKDDSGQWMIAEGSIDKIEHDNPADYYNTVLKMACKRALVAATLTATAASDIFTQDVEEIVENMKAASVEVAPEPPRQSKPTPEPTGSFEESAPAPTPAKAPPSPSTAPKRGITLAGVTTCDCKFVSFKEFNSKPDAKKAWTAWFCQFQDKDGQPFEAGTFDSKIADKLDTLQGGTVTLTYKPAAKEGKYEIVSIEPCDQVPF